MNSMNGKEPVRLLALSDGLFATVLTLLVLDLGIPQALTTGGGNITAIVRSVGPHLFSYVLTFWVAGTYWLAHHRDFDYVTSYDGRLLGYNLLFLLFIGLFPFSTAGVSLGSSTSNDFPFWWAIYAANFIFAGVMLNLTWNYAVSHQLIQRDTSQQQSRYITVRQLATPGVFLISILAEFLFPQAYLGPYTLLLIPLVMWLVDRFMAPPAPPAQVRHARWTERLWRAGTLLPWLMIIGLAVWAMTL